jgi:hypothetical protein
MSPAPMKLITAAAVVAALLSGCENQSKPDAAGSSRHPLDVGAGPATTVSEDERTAKGLPPGPGVAPPPTTTTKPTASPPNRQPVATPPAAPANSAIAEPDLFERRTKAEGTRILSGSNAQVEWRLYAWHSDKKETCLGFYSATHTFDGGNSGGGTMCKQRLPLDVSGSRSPEGYFLFGLVAPHIVRVRVEHADGGTESFDTVSAAGFAERFYAGEVTPTPLKRVVGLDANGKVVAEKDVSTYGQAVPD